ERVLQLIQDVEGVVGSFVANAAGHLVIQQVPPDLPKSALRRTALRVARIIHSAELCELDVERCDFRFDGYQVLVWRFESGLLGVLADAPLQRRALGMAARMALQELRASWPPSAPSGVHQAHPAEEGEYTTQYLTPAPQPALNHVGARAEHAVGFPRQSSAPAAGVRGRHDAR
ncbi:MAG: hypothetical protein RL685_5942, partial [Pseudomonadota bacterium]